MNDGFKKFSLIKFLLFNFIIFVLIVSSYRTNAVGIGVMSVLPSLFVIVYLSLFLYRENIIPAKFIGTFTTDWILWKSVVLLMLPLLIIDFSANQLFLSLLNHYRPDSHMSMVTQNNIDTQRSLLVFANIFLLPLQTELLRGILIRNFLLKYSVSRTIFFSTIIISIFTLSPLSGTLIGLASALIYIKTKALSNTILFHVLINMIIEIIAFFKLSADPNLVLLYSFMILISFMPLAYYFYRTWPSTHSLTS